MSPTAFTWKGYRFFFFSKEEVRPHVHVAGADGEAKFWLEPAVTLAKKQGLSDTEVRALQRIVEERQDELIATWHRHFRTGGHAH